MCRGGGRKAPNKGAGIAADGRERPPRSSAARGEEITQNLPTGLLLSAGQLTKTGKADTYKKKLTKRLQESPKPHFKGLQFGFSWHFSFFSLPYEQKNLHLPFLCPSLSLLIGRRLCKAPCRGQVC